MPPIQDSDRPKEASFIKVRYLIIVMATLCPVVCYMSRQNLSMAMVAMIVDPSESKFTSLASTINNQTNTQNNNIAIETCPVAKIIAPDGSEQSAPKVKTYGPKYDWSQSDISLIFESFFVTYVICQIPAARFSEIVGAGWILLTATTGSAVLGALIPIAATIHPLLCALIRALMGVCQAALYPSCYVLYSRWLPPAERSQSLPLLMVGAFVGSIITSTLTGYLSEQESFGWEYSFYLGSLVCIIWSILWLLVGASKPEEHKFISHEELNYIKSKLELNSSNFREKKSPSWVKIIKSPAIWVMSIAFFATNWSFTLTLLVLPSYLNDVLLVPPLKNGIINSIIFILYCIGAPIAGSVSTAMVERKTLSRLNVRKLFQSIALFSQVLSFLLIIISGCDTTLVMAILYVQVTLYSFVNGGEVQLASELSLDYAGTIYAIGNCIGSSTGFIIPRVRSLMVPNTLIMDDWNNFFYLSSFITLFGGSAFLIFGRNDLQDFDKDLEETHIDVYREATGMEFNTYQTSNNYDKK